MFLKTIDRCSPLYHRGYLPATATNQSQHPVALPLANRSLRPIETIVALLDRLLGARHNIPSAYLRFARSR